MPTRIKVGDRVRAKEKNVFDVPDGTLGTVEDTIGGSGLFYYEVRWDGNPVQVATRDHTWPMRPSEIEKVEED